MYGTALFKTVANLIGKSTAVPERSVKALYMKDIMRIAIVDKALEIWLSNVAAAPISPV
jgi:hypothetical protein